MLAWDEQERALLHLENRTRFPNLQEVAGSFNAKRAYLPAAIAQCLGIPRFHTVTHVVVAVWSAEVLHAIRLRDATFRSLCPDPLSAFEAWWAGRVPPAASATTLAILDPLAYGRRRAFVGLDEIATVRPRYRDYAALAAELRRLRAG